MFELPELSPEWLEVGHAASVASVSSRRIRALIQMGVLESDGDRRPLRVRRTSLVSYLAAGRRGVRPLSDRSIGLLLDALALTERQAISEQWSKASGVERSRARDRVRRLMEDHAPAELLRAWFRHDPHRVLDMQVAADALAAGQFPRTGISHPVAGMAAPDLVEIQARVAPRSQRHGLRARVHIRPGPVRLGELLVDLARHSGDREDHAVAAILASVGSAP